MSATATRDDLSLIAVIMKGETSAIRFAEAQKLLDYGFKNFEYSTFCKQGETFRTITVDKGIFPNVDVVFENDNGTLMQKGSSKDISANIELEDKVSAPVIVGQPLGRITYSINGEVIGTTNLVANSQVKKLTLPNMMARTFEDWFSMLRDKN